MKKKLQKFISQKAVSVDEENHVISFVISTEDRDRQGEIVKQDGWNTENYEKNPVVLFGHNSWNFPIGKAIELIYDEVKKRTIAAIQFAFDEYDEAATAFKLAAGGYLNTTSVGFINTESEGDELTKNELLEISLVPIPANPNAIALAYETGDINQKDAEWLVKNFESSLESLKKTMNNKKEGNIMNAEQEKMLTDTVEKLTELSASVETLAQNVQTVVEKLTTAPEKKSGTPAKKKDNDEGEEEGDPKPNADDPSANSDANDEGAENGGEAVTLESEVDPENMSDEEAKLFQAELQKRLEGAQK